MDPNFPDVVLRPGGGRRVCRVVFSYTPQNEDELALKDDEEIEFISEVEEGWWRGRIGGKVGVFPSNFVVELTPSVDDTSFSEGDTSSSIPTPDTDADVVPILPPKPIREQCKVLFSYDAAIEDELTLKKDDIVTIISKDVEDKGWWKGELRGKIGLFPDNFVQIISPADETAASQLKKPDRPVKNIIADAKVDSKIPLIYPGTKKPELESTNNAHNETAAKRKSADLDLIKPDTVASHRKSLEEKAANEAPSAAGKKPPLRPPVSGKPKPPAAAKPTSVKRLSAEINDLVDGALPSKLTSRLKSIDSAESAEELDLDIVSRSDMLSHITASRPRAPGRRPPTSTATSNNKENEGGSLLTNGTSDGIKVEISPKEKQKQHLPFMDELKVNLKSNKPVLDVSSTKNSFGGWGSKTSSQTSQEISKTSISSSIENHVKSVTSSDIRQSSSAISTSSSSAVSSLWAVEQAESIKSKPAESTSLFGDKVIRAANDSSHPEHASRKEVHDLRLKVEKLERTVNELVSLLREEADKRRQVEKELAKLTDLVTQV